MWSTLYSLAITKPNIKLAASGAATFNATAAALTRLGGTLVQEQLGQASEIYNLIVTFLVNYSFQILGAILILIAGVFLAGKISNWLFLHILIGWRHFGNIVVSIKKKA